MKILVHLSRILVGLTFIFSGFVKGIDPWGSAYKFIDYFNAMGLTWLAPVAFALGVLLAFAEFLIGASLLFSIKIRFFSWAALFFMLFFTGLTFWIALYNPVSDCGCFGDALVISNWETFYKNLVLIALTIIVFLYRKKTECLLGPKTGNILGALTIALYIGIVVYSYRHEPVIDFRPFKVGVNIPDAMKIPADAPHDVYENAFYYKNKNTGEVKKFTEENYPWQDTVNWVFEKMDEPRLVKKGYRPPIHNFTIETGEGENISDFFLYDENYVFMLIAYDINKTSTKNQDKINELANWALSNNLPFICLTASLTDDCVQYATETGAPYEFFHCDETTLKTIIRSNPGLLVIKNGTIEAKWHHNDIPDPETFRKKFLNK